MAIINCSYRSAALEKTTTFNMILPDNRKSGSRLKVLYLLHGFMEDYSAWLSFTSIARYVRYENIAVIMPDAQKSFYADMHYGDNYYTFIAKELPRWCAGQFNLSLEREDNFIAGLSMGGYGAMKIGLSNLDFYRAIGAFSPACDVNNIKSGHEVLYTAIMGDKEAAGSDADIYKLCADAQKAEKKPLTLYHWCGSRDFMINENRDFAQFMKTQTFCDYTFSETDGDHSWQYWDREIEKFIGIIKKLRD